MINPIDELMARLVLLRQEQMQDGHVELMLANPDAVNKIIAEIINLLEHLYLLLNMPQDGFYPFDGRKDNDG